MSTLDDTGTANTDSKHKRNIWTNDERVELIRLRIQGAAFEDIGKKIGRSRHSTRSEYGRIRRGERDVTISLNEVPELRNLLPQGEPHRKTMTEKPSAILIGDSICMGYRPLVKERLADRVEILGIEGNGGDSGHLLANLDEWMINRNAALIHFNCGLHDLKFERDTKAYQQPIETYEANLKKIVERLQGESKARLVWATTTPVIDERHNAVKEFDRYLSDVQAYNRVAHAIMSEAGIPMDDLYSVIQNDDVEACLVNDGVHMTEHGNKILTDAVCDCILHQLGL